MSNIQGARGRGDVHSFDPEDLVIVTDPQHALYDPRHALEPTPEEIANVIQYGILQTILVRREGDKYLVVVGRQRVKWARAANKLLKSRKQAPILVTCRIDRHGENELQGVIIAENECRRADSPAIQSEKLRRYMSLGHDKADAAATFAWPMSRIDKLLALAECAPEVRDAVEAKQIPLSEVKRIARQPIEEQVSVAAVSSVTRVKSRQSPRLGKKEILKGIEDFKVKELEKCGIATGAEFAESVALWILGEGERPW
jgi:ParB family chromosome partitioning protein